MRPPRACNRKLDATNLAVVADRITAAIHALLAATNVAADMAGGR